MSSKMISHALVAFLLIFLDNATAGPALSITLSGRSALPPSHSDILRRYAKVRRFSRAWIVFLLSLSFPTSAMYR
jgi:hypothetical protein